MKHTIFAIIFNLVLSLAHAAPTTPKEADLGKKIGRFGIGTPDDSFSQVRPGGYKHSILEYSSHISGNGNPGIFQEVYNQSSFQQLHLDHLNPGQGLYGHSIHKDTDQISAMYNNGSIEGGYIKKSYQQRRLGTDGHSIHENFDEISVINNTGNFQGIYNQSSYQQRRLYHPDQGQDNYGHSIQGHIGEISGIYNDNFKGGYNQRSYQFHSLGHLPHGQGTFGRSFHGHADHDLGIFNFGSFNGAYNKGSFQENRSHGTYLDYMQENNHKHIF